MKKLIYLIMVIVALSLIIAGCGIPVVPPVEQNEPGTLPNKSPDLIVPDDYTTIQAAISAASPGETIFVRGGNYSEQLTISKSLSIIGIGVSRDSIIIDASGVTSGYGISVTADNVTLENFTLKGPAHAGGYGIHTSGCNNVTFENLLVVNSGRSGIDFIGCNNIKINNVEAKNNDGVGIAITDSSNAKVSNITTSDNEWAGMAVFTSGEYYDGGCNNIRLAGDNNFGEPYPFFTQTHNFKNVVGADLITNLRVSKDFQYIMRTPLTYPYETKTGFFPALNYALGAGVFAVLSGATDAVVNDVITETPLVDYGTYYVGPGMIIQSAINAASSGNTIIVAAGTYTPSSTIIIDKNNLTLNGPQADVDPRPCSSTTRIPGSTAEAIIDGNLIVSKYIIFIAANNVVINGFEVKSGLLDGMIFQIDSYTGTVVKYNIVHDSVKDEGVQLKECTDGVIEYNYVYNTAGDALNFAYSQDCIIQFNEVRNADDRAPVVTWGGAIYTYQSTNIDIIGNRIYDTCSHGIVYGGGVIGNDVHASTWPDFRNTGGKVEGNTVFNVKGDGLWLLSDDTIVKNNEIYDCSRNGIQIVGANIVVQNNNLHDNEVGISVKDIAPIYSTNILVRVNNLAGNNWGIHSEAVATTVNARANWWGDASGPTHANNPNGTGVKVSDYVLYKPWLKKALPKW
jgi:hypothetical protein